LTQVRFYQPWAFLSFLCSPAVPRLEPGCNPVAARLPPAKNNPFQPFPAIPFGGSRAKSKLRGGIPSLEDYEPQAARGAGPTP
jgi:hypothetical protein